MRIIIGLGNPGKKYAHTRHNAGFRVADALARELGLIFKFEKRFNAETAKSDDVMLVKPQTFMNNSGQAVAAMKNFYNLNNTDILTIHDEIDLPLGKLKLAKDSGSAGHNGVESVIQHIGRGFFRLRIGVENREQNRIPPTEDYVLENFRPEEEEKLGEIIRHTVAEIKTILNF